MEIIYSFLYFTIAGLFGAFVRWLLFNRDKSFHEVLLGHLYQNSMIGILIIGIVWVVYVNFIE